MMTRMMFVAGALLMAGAASATVTSVPAAEEKALETGLPAGNPYFDYGSCSVDSKAIAAAMLQVPAEERGAVEAVGGCVVGAEKTFPTQVDARYRR